MLNKISDTVYYTKHKYSNLEPAIGYINGDKFSVMIDTGNSKKQIDEFFLDLEKNNLKKPDVAILTHHHWDHSFGAYYVNTNLVATKKCYEHLKKMTPWLWDDESMNDRIKLGLDIKFSYDMIKKIYPARDIKIKLPDIYKDSKVTLNLGNVKVICYPNDNSHSDDAFLVYIEEEKILFLGDSHSKCYDTTPMSFNKEKLKNYISVIENIDFNIAIPGHGNTMTKRELLTLMNLEYAKIKGE